MFRRASVLLLALPLVAKAFVVPSSRAVAVAGDCQSAYVLQQRQASSLSPQPATSWSTAIHSSSNDDEDAVPTSRRRRKAAGLDPEMRSKLLSESIAPWRTVRLFLYVAAGSQGQSTATSNFQVRLRCLHGRSFECSGCIYAAH